MQIGKPIDSRVVRVKNDWQEIVVALDNLPDGMALPITTDTKNQALNLVSFVYQKMNRNGKKYQCNRRDMTVYITRAESELS